MPLARSACVVVSTVAAALPVAMAVAVGQVDAVPHWVGLAVAVVVAVVLSVVVDVVVGGSLSVVVEQPHEELSVGLSVGDDVTDAPVAEVVLEVGLPSGLGAGVVEPVAVTGGEVDVVGGSVVLALGDGTGSVVEDGPLGLEVVRTMRVGRGGIGG